MSSAQAQNRVRRFHYRYDKVVDELDAIAPSCFVLMMSYWSSNMILVHFESWLDCRGSIRSGTSTFEAHGDITRTRIGRFSMCNVLQHRSAEGRGTSDLENLWITAKSGK